MVGIKDVAKAAGVGVATVSRAINNTGYVSKENKIKIFKAIEELNFVPNQTARNLKNNSSKMIAVFIPTLAHPFFCTIVEYIENYLSKNGYKIIIVSSQYHIERETEVIQMLKRRQVDGIIFLTHYSHNKINTNLPIVTVDRRVDNLVPCITSDNYEATYRAIELLINKKCRNIVFIGGRPEVTSEILQRKQAYDDVMNNHNLRAISYYENIEHGDEKELVVKMLEENKNIDAIFASSDVIAMTCYNIITSKGIKVPEEIKIIGYDGMLNNWIAHPIISSCKQDLEKMAEAIVEQLIKKINSEKTEEVVIIPTKFIEGETI